MDQLTYNTFEYWFNHPTLKQGGDHYKSSIVFEGLVTTLDIPNNGYCLQLGVNTGCTLNLMKQHFGEFRTRGIDMFNVNNDPYVFTLDINNIDFDIPIAYAENDIGTVHECPEDRLFAFKWAIKNLVPGGMLITTSNVANEVFGESVESICKSHNCTWKRLDEYDHMSWASYMNKETIWNTISMMLVTKSI